MPLGRVDVVCVAYGAVEGLEEALQSARSELTASLVVVDHGAHGAEGVAARLGAFWLQDLRNPGFGVGQNSGIALGAAEYVLMLNPDCRLEPGAVAAGISYLDEHPEVAMVQGVITNARTGKPERSQGIELGPVHLWARALALRGLLRSNRVADIARRGSTVQDHVDRVPAAPKTVETLAATAVMIRRTSFEAVGGFDPSYFLYGEDLDLCRRLRSHGWRLVALPNPWGTHLSGASSSDWVQRELSWWEGTMQFAARWWAWPAFALAVGAVTVRAGTIALRSPRHATTAVRRLVSKPVRLRAGRS